MNLSKLFEIQAQLDKRIIESKGLQDQDLLDEKILALQVELGELANEWRGFKFWSHDQEPRTEVKCHACKGKGFFDFTEPFTNSHWTDDCGYCDGTGIQEKKPLLEEYVDCLHFILSIGLELGITNVDVVEMGDYTEETTTKTFIAIQSDIISIVDDLETDIFNKFAQSDYETLLARFIGLGELQLGFTWEQIEQAYLDKNKVNHERQANGY